MRLFTGSYRDAAQIVVSGGALAGARSAQLADVGPRVISTTRVVHGAEIGALARQHHHPLHPRHRGAIGRRDFHQVRSLRHRPERHPAVGAGHGRQARGGNGGARAGGRRRAVQHGELDPARHDRRRRGRQVERLRTGEAERADEDAAMHAQNPLAPRATSADHKSVTYAPVQMPPEPTYAPPQPPPM